MVWFWSERERGRRRQRTDADDGTKFVLTSKNKAEKTAGRKDDTPPLPSFLLGSPISFPTLFKFNLLPEREIQMIPFVCGGEAIRLAVNIIGMILPSTPRAATPLAELSLPSFFCMKVLSLPFALRVRRKIRHFQSCHYIALSSLCFMDESRGNCNCAIRT